MQIIQAKIQRLKNHSSIFYRCQNFNYVNVCHAKFIEAQS